MERKVNKPTKQEMEVRHDVRQWTTGKIEHREMEKRMEDKKFKITYKDNLLL